MSEATGHNAKYYIHSIITIIITFGVGFLNPVGSITPLGMDILGIFLGMLYGWIFVGMTDYTTIQGAFQSGIGHNNTLLVIVALLFGYYLDKSQLSRTIAYKIISMKISIGRPWIFTMLYFLAAYIIGAVVNHFACIVLLWSIFYQICDVLKIEKKTTWASYVIIGVAFIAILGSYALPIKETPLFLRGIMEPTLGMSIPFVQWMLWFNIMHLLAVVVYLFIGKFILRPDVTAVKNAGDFMSQYRHIKLPREQHLPLILLLIFISALIFPSFMPETWRITAILSQLGLVGIGTLLIIFLMIIRSKEGVPYADYTELFTGAMNWNLIWLMAATMPICAAMESDATGIISWLTTMLLPIVQNLSPTMFIIVITVGFLCHITSSTQYDFDDCYDTFVRNFGYCQR